MKVKMIFLCVAFFVFAQTSIAQPAYYDKLQLSLSVDQTEWNVGSKVIAKMTVKNISDKKIKITLMPNFELCQKEIPKGEYSAKYTYVSNQEPENSLIFFEISLNKNKSKTVEFEVTKLGWLPGNESLIFGGNWSYMVPKGEYELYYGFWFDFGEPKQRQQAGKIISNKVVVKLNSLE